MVLKELLLGGVVLQEESHHIRVFEHSSALDNLVRGVFEELHLHPSRLISLLALKHPLLSLDTVFMSILKSSIVPVVALVVMQISVQLIFGLVGIVAIPIGLTGIEAIALIVSACALIVFTPRLHAHPAEVVMAELAVHVIAALILFYTAVALGALLRVDDDPVGGFTLTLAFLLP